MSFPYSYSVLGLFPGILLTIVVALFVLYTSLVLWEFCLRHPEVRDVCDIGQMLFWGKTWAWYATAVMFVLNNTFIQACTFQPFSYASNKISGTARTGQREISQHDHQPQPMHRRFRGHCNHNLLVLLSASNL